MDQTDGTYGSQFEAGDACSWWRFTRYEIRGGIVCPAEGATLQPYDPWQVYVQSRVDADDVPPYQSLVNLTRRASFCFEGDSDESGSITLEEEKRPEFLSWCNQHGLLGILPHRAISIGLAPLAIVMPKVPESGSWGPRWDEEGQGSAGLFLIWQNYLRAGARWTVFTPEKGFPFSDARNALRHLRQMALVSEDAEGYLSSRPFGISQKYSSLLPFGEWGRPLEGVIMKEIEHPLVEQFSLVEGIGPFFPTVPKEEREVFRYPEPLSEEFWSIYAEPVTEFVSVGRLFRQLLDDIYSLRVRPDDKGAQAARFLFGGTPHDISLRLETLAEGAGAVTLWEPPGRWVTRRRFPSLIAALAKMIQEDLDAGREPMLCEECQTPFLTSAYQAKYCCVRCRNTAQKRRYREKKRAGKKPDGG